MNFSSIFLLMFFSRKKSTMALEKIPKKQTTKDETTKIPKISDTSTTSKCMFHISLSLLPIEYWFLFQPLRINKQNLIHHLQSLKRINDLFCVMHHHYLLLQRHYHQRDQFRRNRTLQLIHL